MTKIYIVGIVASGKTTLSRKLSEILNIPCYEFDNIVHCKTDTGRFKRTPEQQIEEIQKLCQ